MPTVHKLTTDDYGALTSGWSGRTELIDGSIYDMSPEYALHARTVRHVAGLLRDVLRDGEVVEVYTSGSLRLTDTDETSPDIFVVPTGSAPGDMEPWRGGDCILVVEVAVTTADHDLGPKVAACARGDIPEYWVVLADQGELRRFRGPRGSDFVTVESFDVGKGAGDLDTNGISRILPSGA